MVYRQDIKRSTSYLLIKDSVRVKILQRNFIFTSNFHCIHETLTLEEYIKIQENDVIGACIKEEGSTQPLLLVGTTGNTVSTYQLDQAGSEECRPTHYANITDADLTLRADHVLHVGADIGMLAIVLQQIE